MTDAIRLVLADDHAMFRAGLKHLFEDHRYAVIGEASTGRETVDVMRHAHPDILLLDFSMPELTGLEVLGHVSQDSPHTRVIFLSMHRHESYVLQALHRGAAGYVVKDSAFQDLLIALRAVMNGETYVSPLAVSESIREFLAHRNTVSLPTIPLESLTPRERQLFQLIAEGKSTKVIADELGISVRTAETHRAHLMRKLQAHNVAELVHVAAHWGIIQL